jgi:hypothetical protein
MCERRLDRVEVEVPGHGPFWCGLVVRLLPICLCGNPSQQIVQTVFSVGMCPSTMATAVPTGRGGYAEILWPFWTGESWFEGLSLVVDASAPRAET